MDLTDYTPCSRPLGRSLLRRFVRSPCRRLLSRCLNHLRRPKECKTPRKESRCIEPEFSICSTETGGDNASDHCSSFSSPSSLELDDSEGLADHDPDSPNPPSMKHGNTKGSLSGPSCPNEPGPTADDAEWTAESGEIVPWREVVFLLNNAEFTRNHEVLSLKEEHEAELASITEERNEALRVVNELVAERNQLFQEKMNWQLKFVTAVAKKHKVSSGGQNANFAEPLSGSKNDTELTRAAADEETPECGGVRPSTAQLDGQQRCHEHVQQDTQRGRIAETNSDGSRERPQKPVAALSPNAVRNQSGNPAWTVEGTVAGELSEGRTRLTGLEEKDFSDFQLRQDLEAALEANQQLQQQLNNQEEEYSYMRNIFVVLTDKIAALSDENADPKARLEAAIGENIILASKRQRDKAALASVTRELSRWKRKGKLGRPRRSRLPNIRVPDGANLRPYQAQLLSHNRLTRSVLRQNSVYLDNFKTALLWSDSTIQRDDLALQLAECLRNTLDRNELLDRKVWNFEHPDTLEHLWLRCESAEQERSAF